MVLLEAEGVCPGGGLQGATWEGRALWLLRGRGHPAQGTSQCEHQTGRVPRAGPCSAPDRTAGAPVLMAEGAASEPKQEAEKVFGWNTELCPLSQKVWSEVPGDHWLEDHTKWIGHPEVTGGRCGGQKTALPPWKSEMRRQGQAKPPAQGGSQERTRAAARALLKGGRSAPCTQPRVPTRSSAAAAATTS